MNRRILFAAIVSCFAGATALAGDQLAFDSIGSMMLEHEAEENHDTSDMYASTALSDRVAQRIQCKQEEAELKARMKELEASFTRSFSQSLKDFKMRELKAIEAKATEMTAHLKALELDRADQLELVSATLATHQAELAKYRKAFKDSNLLRQVERALEQAERALLAE